MEGLVDENKQFLSDLAASGNAEALKRVLENQQEEVFKKAGRARQMLEAAQVGLGEKADDAAGEAGWLRR